MTITLDRAVKLAEDGILVENPQSEVSRIDREIDTAKSRYLDLLSEHNNAHESAKAELKIRIRAISDDIKALKAKRKKTLGVEKDLRAKISSRIKELRKRRRKLRDDFRFDWRNKKAYIDEKCATGIKTLEKERDLVPRKVSMQALGYKHLDMEVLQWRRSTLNNSVPEPRLAIFPLSRSIFRIPAGSKHIMWFILITVPAMLALQITLAAMNYPAVLMGEEHIFFGPLMTLIVLMTVGVLLGQTLSEFVVRLSHFGRLPKKIRMCYKDVRDWMKDNNFNPPGINSLRYFEISAGFSGAIPPKTRLKIDEANRYFREIFLINEPVEWVRKVKKIEPPRLDPLVVGWDGKYLWLVDKFNTTPLEEWTAQEFTS